MIFEQPTSRAILLMMRDCGIKSIDLKEGNRQRIEMHDGRVIDFENDEFSKWALRQK